MDKLNLGMIWLLRNNGQYECDQSWWDDVFQNQGLILRLSNIIICLINNSHLLWHNTDEWEWLCHHFIIIGSQKSLHDGHDLTFGNFVRILDAQYLDKPDPKISKALSVHTEVDNSIEQLIRKHNVDNISHMRHGLILQK